VKESIVRKLPLQWVKSLSTLGNEPFEWVVTAQIVKLNTTLNFHGSLSGCFGFTQRINLFGLSYDWRAKKEVQNLI